MTMGQVILKTRETPDDIWSPGKQVAILPWVSAQKLARDQGFNIEEAVR